VLTAELWHKMPRGPSTPTDCNPPFTYAKKADYAFGSNPPYALKLLEHPQPDSVAASRLN